MTVKAIVFPECLSIGSRFGPGYRTRIIQTAGGSEYRNATQSKPRYRYDVRQAAQTENQWSTLLDFMHAVEGSLYGFLFVDPMDHSTAADHRSAPASTDVEIGTGTGSETQFQLRTRYVEQGETKYRTITKPKSGTVVVDVAGTEKSEGTDWTVDTSTGVVTFEAGSVPAWGESVTAGCEFYVPVRFEASVDQWMSFSLEQVLANVQSIGIVEIPDQLPVFELGMCRGAPASVTSLSGAVALSVEDGAVQRYTNTSGATQNVNLPAKSAVSFGGPIVVVAVESGATSSVAIVDSDTATTLTTLSAGDAATLYMTRDASGNREWLAV